MERLSRPKDDLFENSTMTFGEHLEELRQCLVRAILWLAAGLIIGLFFADSVIIFVKTPLERAIQQFNADRDLHRLGYADLDADELQPLREFLMQN
ncbi:MAG: twin-arginine translocase subunit TatC, partial [Pirellulales bacterium]|nr:twin-arginine translocase subunit TatC [Pirellulales bacterium]